MVVLPFSLRARLNRREASELFWRMLTPSDSESSRRHSHDQADHKRKNNPYIPIRPLRGSFPDLVPPSSHLLRGIPIREFNSGNRLSKELAQRLPPVLDLPLQESVLRHRSSDHGIVLFVDALGIAKHRALIVAPLVQHEDLLEPVESRVEVRQPPELPRGEVSAESGLHAAVPTVDVAPVEDDLRRRVRLDELLVGSVNRNLDKLRNSERENDFYLKRKAGTRLISDCLAVAENGIEVFSSDGLCIVPRAPFPASKVGPGFS